MTANRKVTARYAEIARFLGLHFNEEFCVAYGEKDGFTLRVSGLDTGRGIEYGMVCISVGVAENGVKFEPDKQFRKEHKGIMGVVQEKHTVRMTLKRYVRVEKIKGILQESLPAFLDMLRMEGFTNGCELCGEMKETGAAYVAGNAICLCDECYDKATQNAAAYTANEKNKKENLVGGVVGALIGSLLGAASIILLSQLGYVAAISGVIMAVCALKGYELLGGKLTKKGVIISGVIMIVMTYVGDRVDWAIMIARELETDVFYGYRLLPLLLSEEVIDMTTGQRLGYVCDAEIDLEEGKIVSLIVPGQKKLGGLLSGDDDYILPWESISRLGEDIILAEVAAQQPRRRREKRQNYLG